MKLRRGRPTKGVDHVDGIDVSRDTKRRLKVILRVISGEVLVKDGASMLGLSTTRVEQLRTQALEGAASALEPRAPGRPRKERPDDSQTVAEVKRELDWTAWELEAARVREEIAQVWPHLLVPRPSKDPRGKASASRNGRPKPGARRDTSGRATS